MPSFRTTRGLNDRVSPAFIHEKPEAKEGGSKLLKVLEQVSGGSTHPRLTHLRSGVVEGRNACDILGPVLGI